MRKTYCDGCGAECVNRVIVLQGSIQHHTNRGEQVGWDDLKPVELCQDCFEPIQKTLGIEIRPQDVPPDYAVAIPRPLVSDVPG